MWLLHKHEVFYTIDASTVAFKNVGRISVTTVIEAKSSVLSEEFSAGKYNVFYTAKNKKEEKRGQVSY